MRTVYLALASLALLAVLPAPAPADVLDFYDDYRSSGSVKACEHSAEELRAALDDVPADISAYDPGFVDALNAALDRRASGCEATAAAGEPSAASVTADDGSPGPPDPRHQVRPKPASAADGAPIALLFGAVAIVLTGSLAAAAGIGRREGRR